MSRRRRERLPRRRGHAALDAALDGRDTDSDPVARVLDAARAPGTEAELAGLEAARAAFSSAADDAGDDRGGAQPEPLPGRERRRRRGMPAFGLAGVSLGATVGVAAAAAAGVTAGVVIVTHQHPHHHHPPGVPSRSASPTPTSVPPTTGGVSRSGPSSTSPDTSTGVTDRRSGRPARSSAPGSPSSLLPSVTVPRVHPSVPTGTSAAGAVPTSATTTVRLPAAKTVPAGPVGSSPTG